MPANTIPIYKIIYTIRKPTATRPLTAADYNRTYISAKNEQEAGAIFNKRSPPYWTIQSIELCPSVGVPIATFNAWRV